MRLTGNAAKVMLVAAMAAMSQHTPYYMRRETARQYRRMEEREMRRFRRIASDPIGGAQRANAALERRASIRYANHLKCLANNPCLG
jgi:hypothetical protein